MNDALAAGHTVGKFKLQVVSFGLMGRKNKAVRSISQFQEGLVKARLIRILVDIVVGTELEVDVSLVVSGDLHLSVNDLAHFVGSGDCSSGVLSSRLVGLWSLVRISTNSTFASIFLPLVLQNYRMRIQSK